jgi:Icc-related predicted phosphoesterase
MKITAISDLHGFQPELPGGDLLIIAGDLTARDTRYEYDKFSEWLSAQKYEKKVFIAGNHDKLLQNDYNPMIFSQCCKYLKDSSTEFEGLKIWGSPWTKTFIGMNPKCKAFTVDTDEELAEKWELIPKDIDILITHCPPKGFLDFAHGQHLGSKSLFDKVAKIKFPNLKLHVFGHIHEWGGNITNIHNNKTIFNNASLVNETYDPINRIVTREL